LIDEDFYDSRCCSRSPLNAPAAEMTFNNAADMTFERASAQLWQLLAAESSSDEDGNDDR
jgi:hypothetical protein